MAYAEQAHGCARKSFDKVSVSRRVGGSRIGGGGGKEQVRGLMIEMG
jgi:hypothetical protein